MRRYYFRLMSGEVTRDRQEADFAAASEAIQYGQRLAQRFCSDGRSYDPELLVCVVNENGAEIHRERVFRQKPARQPYGPAQQ